MIRQRADRVMSVDEWIQRAIDASLEQHVQADGRIRRWGRVPEAGNRMLRVVLLADGEICAMTIEHASRRAGVPQFSYEQVAA